MRRSLVVGTNYTGKSYQLSMTENDARLFGKMLQQIFPTVQQTYLLGPIATKAKVLATLTELVHQTLPGDVLYFFFSGHGTQILADNDPEDLEEDNYDEAILADDSIHFSSRDSLIVDDELNQIIRQLPAGAEFRAVIDACHSGTLFDLRYDLTDTSIKNLGLVSNMYHNDKDPHLSAISLGSSKDNEKSFEDQQGGILITLLEQLIRQQHDLTSLVLLQRLKEKINQTRIRQTPFINMNQPQILNRPFFI